jgi:hypothetical protein
MANAANERFNTVLTVAPYLAWMGLMLALPTAAWAYASRAAVAGALLLAFMVLEQKTWKISASAVAWGVGAGILVCVLWIWPESFDIYRRLFVIGGVPAEAVSSPYDPAVCGWALTMAKLVGSAFVIAPAEELFFRSFLYRWIQGDGARIDRFDASAFLWTVALFALEHNRWLAGAMAGAIYGILAIRKGLGSAIIAHATTNLALGVWVILRGEWAFW